MIVECCLFCVVCWLLFRASWSLFVALVRFMWCIVCGLLFVVCWALELVGVCLLFVVCSSLFNSCALRVFCFLFVGVCCLLVGVWCLVLVVRCWLFLVVRLSLVVCVVVLVFLVA